MKFQGMGPESDALTARLRYPEGVAGGSGFIHPNLIIPRGSYRDNGPLFTVFCTSAAA